FPRGTASSNAVSRILRVSGSKDPLPIPSMFPLRKHLVDKGLLGEKQHQTVRVVMRTLGHVALAPIALIMVVALIMIVLGGVVFSLVLIYGAIAQLGERLNGIQEVRGSTPLGSTNLC